MSLTPLSIERNFNGALDRFLRAVGHARIHPNTISTTGFTFNIIASVLLASGEFVAAGLFILCSGLLDMLDGKVARSTKQTTTFGAIYDATVDRIGEIAVYTGIGAYFIMRNMHLTTLVVVMAVGGSVMISYVRARAESYGIACSVGILRRGERVLLLGIGATLNFLGDVFHQPIQQLISFLAISEQYAFPPMPLTLVLIGIAVLSPITVAQRLIYVKMQE